MAGLSDSLENAILDHVFRNTAYTAPATVYVGLYTAAPTDAGGGTEVSTSGTAYARQAVTFSAASGGSTSNSGTVTFPTATASWGTVTHFGVFSASSGGTLLGWAALSASKAIDNTDAAVFAAGALVLTLD